CFVQGLVVGGLLCRLFAKDGIYHACIGEVRSVYSLGIATVFVGKCQLAVGIHHAVGVVYAVVVVAGQVQVAYAPFAVAMLCGIAALLGIGKGYEGGIAGAEGIILCQLKVAVFIFLPGLAHDGVEGREVFPVGSAQQQALCFAQVVVRRIYIPLFDMY